MGSGFNNISNINTRIQSVGNRETSLIFKATISKIILETIYYLVPLIGVYQLNKNRLDFIEKNFKKDDFLKEIKDNCSIDSVNLINKFVNEQKIIQGNPKTLKYLQTQDLSYTYLSIEEITFNQGGEEIKYVDEDGRHLGYSFCPREPEMMALNQAMEDYSKLFNKQKYQQFSLEQNGGAERKNGWKYLGNLCTFNFSPPYEEKLARQIIKQGKIFKINGDLNRLVNYVFDKQEVFYFDYEMRRDQVGGWDKEYEDCIPIVNSARLDHLFGLLYRYRLAASEVGVEDIDRLPQIMLGYGISRFGRSELRTEKLDFVENQVLGGIKFKVFEEQVRDTYQSDKPFPPTNDKYFMRDLNPISYSAYCMAVHFTSFSYMGEGRNKLEVPYGCLDHQGYDLGGFRDYRDQDLEEDLKRKLEEEKRKLEEEKRKLEEEKRKQEDEERKQKLPIPVVERNLMTLMQKCQDQLEWQIEFFNKHLVGVNSINTTLDSSNVLPNDPENITEDTVTQQDHYNDNTSNFDSDI